MSTTTTTNNELNMLADYISFIRSSFIPIKNRKPYYHMGATLSDSILQAGLNYRTVVYPRIQSLLLQYSDYKTTSDFIILYKNNSLQNLLNWNNAEKLKRLDSLSLFLFNEHVETEDDLSKWLHSDDNIMSLHEIKGIGPKTVDYLKMMSGIPSIPIDRHLFKFLELAGIKTDKYEYASYLYTKVSTMININKYELDFNIWTLMSSISKTIQVKSITK